MRTRLIRPTFWADATVASLPVPARLTFMGLWGLSDDDGYFDWRPAEIAAELYRYAPTKARVRAVEDHLTRLAEAGPIQQLDCGRHGRIASMPNHRIQSGRHSFPTREHHLGTCVAGRAVPRNSASRSLSVTESETVSVRIGSDSGAQPRAGASPLDAVAAQVGGFAGRMAARKTA
jgi:hypothetical protein